MPLYPNTHIHMMIICSNPGFPVRLLGDGSLNHYCVVRTTGSESSPAFKPQLWLLLIR